MTQNSILENNVVSWTVDDITVYGTVTRPMGGTARSAIVFVAGSGPTDRDWCSPLIPGKNGSAKLLAEALAGQGFVTLRYDKRASGPHVQENLPKMIGKISMQSHVDELAGAVQTVLSEKDVDPHEVFVLTNSEGAIHALNYQLHTQAHRFKGLVLTGAPGRAIGDVARTQISNQLVALPNAGGLLKHYDDAVADFIAGKPIVPDASLPDGVKQLLLGLATPANLPFAREFWMYDASRFISMVKEPILVVIGKKDLQVDWQKDGHVLEAVTAKKGNATFVYPENADHVLKHEEQPREKLNPADVGLHYNDSDRTLDQEALHAIFHWLAKKA
jgi:alpha-beta hydrolase superfamily lysophospholipase